MNLMKAAIAALYLSSVVYGNAQMVTTVTVPSNPLWTDTGIYLFAGESVTIQANGSWRWVSNVPNCGPDGIFCVINDTFLDDGMQAELIGFIGYEPASIPHVSPYFAVGSSRSLNVVTSGELWLGFNDDAFGHFTGDNSGYVTATITGGTHSDSHVDYNFTPSTDGEIYDVALDANGRILIAGWFTHVNGQLRVGVARLNSDGTLDDTFDASDVMTNNLNPVTIGDVGAYCVAVDSLGRIYVGGDSALIRVTPAGKFIYPLDFEEYMNGFVMDSDGPITTMSGAGQVIQIATPPGESILQLGGTFTTGEGNNSIEDLWIARDWYVDDSGVNHYTGVIPPPTSAWVGGMLQLPNGGEVVCGDLATLDGDWEIGYARSPGWTFHGGADSYVWAMALQPDGKIVVGGEFSALGTNPWYTFGPGSAHYVLGRFNSDGTVDETFNPIVNGIWSVHAIFLQSNGQILVGGGNIARFNPNGSSDSTVNIGVNGTVNKMVQQTDGKVIAVGSFSTFGGQTHQNIARFSP